MKKVISIILLSLFLFGCSHNTAKEAVERYLKKYKSLDSQVLVDMESIIEKENLTKGLQDKYRSVLKKQYKDLGYKIEKEEYDNDISYVTVKVSVYDLYKAQRDASIYFENNKNDFMNEDNSINEEKYLDYKLEQMKNMMDRIEYTIIFTVTKEKDKYVVMQPTESDLKKIHGIYNYELN